MKKFNLTSGRIFATVGTIALLMNVASFVLPTTQAQADVFRLPSWTTPINISNSPNISSFRPKIVVDTKGNQFIFWSEANFQTGDPSTFGLFFSKYENGGFTTPVPVVGPRILPTSFDIAIDKQDVIHLVYDIGWQTFYKKYSNDIWSLPETITSKGGSATVAVDSNNNPHVMYIYPFYPTGAGTYYARRTTSQWTEPILLTSDAGQSNGINKTMAIDEHDNIHIVWIDTGPLGGYLSQIIYRKFDGVSWSSSKIIATGYATIWTGIESKAGITAIIYNKGITPRSTGDEQVHILISKDIGNTWTAPIKISEPKAVGPAWSHLPTLSIDNVGGIHIMWGECGLSNGCPPPVNSGVPYRLYSNNQLSVVQDISGGTLVAGQPNITTTGDKIYAVWTSNGEIYYASTQIINPEPADTLVALGDSFSSGFGILSYEEGTYRDEGFNNCQRSESAYPKVVAEELGLDLSFHACNGATTKHLYERRIDELGNDWGEPPQLENLNNEAKLVTLTIGGNDVGFADVLKECADGVELLPFNTCFSDKKVTEPVQEALMRLDGGDGSADIKSYDVIYKAIRRLSPFAKGVAVGYPHLFTASGDDRTFLPGGRCELIKKADQRWMIEKIDELNGIIKRNALRNGLLFALPVFDGHELCSGGEEWIFGLLSAGRFHPTINGHRAIAKAVTDELLNDAQNTKILIEPFQTFAYTFSVESGKALLSFTSEWPGSDIVTSLQSPSGVIYTRNSGNVLHHDNGAMWEHYEIGQPEVGIWTATLYGADVVPEGEDVKLSVYLEDPPNQPPVGNISWRIEGTMLMLDGGGSYDPDGQIISYDWYITTPQGEEVYSGQVAQHPLAQKVPTTITLVVTDDRRITDFVSVTVIPIDVHPGSDVNPINPNAKGVLPVAILSSTSFDASTINSDSLRLGLGQAKPAKNGVHREDVNNDGIIDLMLQFPIQQLGIKSGESHLCMTGELPDGKIFESCDKVKIK